MHVQRLMDDCGQQIMPLYHQLVSMFFIISLLFYFLFITVVALHYFTISCVFDIH